MRILLVRLRQIGDVVFTTPAIRALHEQYPDALLSYIVEPAAAPIVIHNSLIHEVIVAPRRRGVKGVLDDLALGRRLRAGRFDLAIDFHGGPRASLLTWLSGAPRRIGYRIVGRSWMYTTRIDRPRALRARHSVENQWDLLAPLGITPPSPSRFPVEMPSDPIVAAEVSDRLVRAGVTPEARLVVIHVSAGNPFRRWPAAYFVDLAVSLAAADPRRRVLVTSGPSEQGAADRVIEEARTRLGAWRGAHVLSCGEFSLQELRALLERAALYIGGDSGPLHVASTTQVPIVGLFGPTLPIRSAPWRNRQWITESVDAGELPCRPCEQRVCAPGDFRCLTSIKPADVLKAAERAMHAAHPSASGTG